MVRDAREVERRLLLDTYRTFGCESGEPTFRYSLLDGVRDGYLINPIVVDARTDVTTQLLSEEGFAAVVISEEGEDEEASYFQRHFEKRFFSEATNVLFCRLFLENGLRDPISGEFGKGIVFAVSQRHAGKLTQILNELADQMWPGRYQSDFAVQVTSNVADAQQYTLNFTNNNLLGSGNFSPVYRTSKARVCVTVGMMTTGYDCPDLLNLALMRPIFSPTDFIQIKGRGTRRHDFTQELRDDELKEQIGTAAKQSYKLFDFFATCEYFEEDYNYDQTLALPPRGAGIRGLGDGRGDGEGGEGGVVYVGYEYGGPDRVEVVKETAVGLEGMKIDRMFFERFKEVATADQFIKENVLAGRWDRVVQYAQENLLDKPEEYFTLDKLRRAVGVNRRLGLREIFEYVFDFRFR